ncbi:RidA family protein [Saccharopolyspora spinosa]|uniref:Enamine deaminase RidA (YjgF/YER057c/UK114 family) n=1 Tax=Saccharopolyspora spinosa TaxID=60894 RepID=A0A2N3Y0G8_SACSN|nr:RidA family protein [Saccharopolyspora spinosa]PKW16409.1 enamine deaminase RidA (YjgF/YER057c/UK114 family) [Saccharopolyspora spinosa]
MTTIRPVPRLAITSADAPPPAGTYSQAVLADGTLYISGQTPRLPDGRRCTDEPFRTQARLTLANLNGIADAAGTRLADAAFVTVYLRDPRSQATEFDAVYQDVIGPTDTPPARAIVQSDLPNGEIEVTAVIPVRTLERDHGS